MTTVPFSGLTSAEMLLYDWLSQVAADRGGAKALVYRDTYLSWRGLVHRVDRRAQELHSVGIGAGAWVGLMLGNVPEFVILGLALSKLGAVVVPLDPTTGTRELEMVLEAAPLRALITRPRGGELAQPGNPNGVQGAQVSMRLPTLPRMPAATSKFPPENRRRLQGTLLTCNLYKRSMDKALSGVAPAVVQFTADVGGDPKGILRTAASLKASASIIAETLDVKNTDRVLCTVPLHHSYGFDFGLLACLFRGATMFLEDEVSPKRIAKLLREHSINFFPATPGLYGAIVRVPTVRPLRIAGTRYISSGARLPASIAEAFHQRLGARLLSCYHSTEAGPVAIDRAGRDPGTVGKPFKGVELRVAKGDGKRLESGDVGPIWIRSEALSPVSVPKVLVTRRGGVSVGDCDSDGWFRTGDLARIDKNGKVTLAGREDDLVKVDGKRVALGEVEGCIESFSKVKETKALVTTDDNGGPMVVARVVRASACTADEIIDYCSRHLAPYKVPRRIEFCDDLA